MAAPDDTQTGAAEMRQSIVVFPPGNPMPSVKALTFYRSGTFTIDVHYIDNSEPPSISTYMVACCAYFPVTITCASLFTRDLSSYWALQIGPFQSSNGERAKLKLIMRLNVHGIVSIESAVVSFQCEAH